MVAEYEPIKALCTVIEDKQKEIETLRQLLKIKDSVIVNLQEQLNQLKPKEKEC